MPANDPSMTLEFFSATDTGRSRSNNEDSVIIDPESDLVVLADGMGGYNAGEVASSMATSLIQAELSRWLSQVAANASDSDVRRAMTLCVDKANLTIFNAAKSNPQQSGMGTTLVVGVFRGDNLLMGTWAIPAATASVTARSARSPAITRCCRSRSMPG